VSELLNGHLCLEVSEIAIIDLDQQDIKGSQIRLHQGMPRAIAVFLYRIAQQLFLQAQVNSPQSKRLSCPSHSLFSQGPVGSELTRADVLK
jgi:hypothetical protein